MKFASAAQAIETLNLEPLEGEGGYYSLLHRDEFGNAIYFLMTPDQFSAWHILNERETWVHLDGAPVELFTRTGDGPTELNLLDHSQFSIVPRTWMAARTTGEFSLMLCFLAPPFSQMTLLSKEEFNNWREREPDVVELIHG